MEQKTPAGKDSLSWLDPILEETITQRDSAPKENAIVAIATIGGVGRMKLLARLIESEIKRAKKSTGSELEDTSRIIAFAVTEARRLPPEQRQELDAALDEMRAGSRSRRASVVDILLREAASPLSEWWVLRRSAPRPSLSDALIPIAIATALTSVALSVLALLFFTVIFGSITQTTVDDFLYWGVGFFASAVVSVIPALLIATPLLREFRALVLDAVIVATVTTVSAALSFSYLEQLAFDSTNLPEVPAGSIPIFMGAAWPVFVLVRVWTGLSRPNDGGWPGYLSALLWGAIGITVAVIGAHLVGRYPDATSLVWFAVIVDAAALGAAVNRLSRYPGASLRSTVGSKTARPAAAVAIIVFALLLSVSLLKPQRQRVEPVVLDTASAMAERPPRSVLPPGVPFLTRVSGSDNRLVLAVGGGTYTFFENGKSILPSTVEAQQIGFDFVAPGSEMLLCFSPTVRCEPVPRTEGPETLFAAITGSLLRDGVAAANADDDEAVYLLEYSPSIDPVNVTLGIGEPRTLDMRSGVVEFEIAGSSGVLLSAQLSRPGNRTRAAVILEHIDRPAAAGRQTVVPVTADFGVGTLEIEEEEVAVGRYRLCARRYQLGALFRDCESFAGDLLMEPITVTLSSDSAASP